MPLPCRRAWQRAWPPAGQFWPPASQHRFQHPCMELHTGVLMSSALGMKSSAQHEEPWSVAAGKQRSPIWSTFNAEMSQQCFA